MCGSINRARHTPVAPTQPGPGGRVTQRAWKGRQPPFQAERGKGSATLYVQSCKTRTASNQSWAGGLPVSQPTAVPLPLLSKIRYSRAAANLKLNLVRLKIHHNTSQYMKHNVSLSQTTRYENTFQNTSGYAKIQYFRKIHQNTSGYIRILY